MNNEIIKVYRRIHFKNSSDFNLPWSSIPKYPVQLKTLLSRIESLQLKYNLPIGVKLYNLNKDMKLAKVELRALAGVYILWNKKTGLFYVGSTIKYVGGRGRLNYYFQTYKGLNVQ